MDKVMPIVQFVTENYQEILVALAGIVGAAEIIVRMTPTKKDDGFVTRVGKILDKAMDSLGVPNSAGTHKRK